MKRGIIRVTEDLKLNQNITIQPRIINSDPVKSAMLNRTSLVRDPYRALINTGRTYAAFTGRELHFLESLDASNVLDPMSGYGLLTEKCAIKGISSFCLEFNPPQYLWQVLVLPQFAEFYSKCIESILAGRTHWPQINKTIVVSDQWWSTDSICLLAELFKQFEQVIRRYKRKIQCNFDIQTLTTALLLPFCGRLSCCVPGDIATHAKKGGMTVFTGWQDDLATYLQAMLQRFSGCIECKPGTSQGVQLGDARTYPFAVGKYDGLFTSPPFPNHRDFTSMFLPEHQLIAIFNERGITNISRPEQSVIGSNFITRRSTSISGCASVLTFLNAVNKLTRSAAAKYDDDVYYIPYFQDYFSGIEKAYSNVLVAMKERFTGYVFVVNNTHRGLVVPVSDSIIEIFQSNGCKAEIAEAVEMFHIGTKNPRAKGARARHTSYAIKVWR